LKKGTGWVKNHPGKNIYRKIGTKKEIDGEIERRERRSL